jgi:hypothetical protein
MSDQTELLLGKVTALEKLGEEVSFLQIGRNKYMVSLVGQDMSIVDELKAYVTNELENIKGEMSGVFEKDIDMQLKKQIDHIQNARRRGQVAIPAALQDKIVKYMHNEVSVVKGFVFNPWCIKGTYNDIHQVIADIPVGHFVDEAAKGRFQRARARDGEWQLTFKCSIMLPGMVCVSGGSLHMVNELMTFHTYNGGNMCTGRSAASAVFSLAPRALGEQLSILNRFSPLSSDIRWGREVIGRYPEWVHSKCRGFALSRNATDTSGMVVEPETDDAERDEDAIEGGPEAIIRVTTPAPGWRVQ